MYRSSSSFDFLAWTLLLGHLIEGPCCWFELLDDCFAKLGSNLRLNCSNFYKSMFVTDFLAVLNASSKCFLVISGTGSKFWAFPPFWIKACILTSASIDWNKLKLYVSDGWFGSLLTDFCQVGTWESICNVSQEVKVNVLGKRGFSQIGLKNTKSWRLVWQWNVNELIQSSGSDDSLIKDFWSVCSSDEENVLLSSDTIHFSE